jgi:MFS family permease
VPYFIAAGAASIVVLLTVFTLDESMTPEERQAQRDRAKRVSALEVLRVRPLVLSLIVVFIAQAGLGVVMATFALFGEAVLFDSNPELGVGMLLGVVGLAQVITQTAMLGPAIDRFGEARVMAAATVIRTAGLGFFAVATMVWLAGIGSAVFAIGSGLLLPTLQSIATKSVDDSMRGGVLGIYQSTTSLAIIFSTAASGLLFAVSPHMPYIVAFGLSAVSLVPAVFLVRYYRRDQQPAVA